MSYDIEQINQQTWSINEERVRFFLLTGSEKALLIDSGMETRNAKEIAEAITHRPVELLNTHADRDHIAGNSAFDSFYMHPAEASNLFNTQKKSGNIVPVFEGSVINLGDRELEIIEIPGHTPGHIAVLDKKYRFLFAGDSVQTGNIHMFGVQREIHAYRLSLQKLSKRKDEFDFIYPCHGKSPVSPDLIDQLYEETGQILDGEVQFTEQVVHGQIVRHYQTKSAGFFLR